MLASCPSCGLETSMRVGSTVLHCPRCKTCAPAAELRFEEDVAVFAVSQPPPRRRRRFTLSPTARAFLLVIAVVAAMSWIVRLLEIAAHPGTKEQRLATAASNEMAVATNHDSTRNAPQIEAFAKGAFAEIKENATQLAISFEHDLAAADSRACLNSAAAIGLSAASMNRLIKASSTNTPDVSHKPLLANAPADKTKKPLAIMSEQAVSLASLAVDLLQRLDEQARFESVTVEIMAAIARTTSNDWRNFAQAMEYTAEILVAAAQLAGAKADEMRELRAAIQASSTLKEPERAIKAMELAARSAALLATARGKQSEAGDMYVKIKSSLERMSELDDYSLDQLTLETAVFYTSLKIAEDSGL